MNEEIWKDVIGYEGLYQVSSFGQIRSRYRPGGQNKVFDSWRLLKVTKSNVGYYCVNLCNANGRRLTLVHRIMKEAFFFGSNKSLQVNHKNGIKTDNRLENLEVCTPSENMKHAYRLGLTKKPPAAGCGRKYRKSKNVIDN